MPHEEILADVASVDVGLVVIGSNNRSGQYRLLLGSVTERATRMATRPVTVVETPVEG